MNEKVPTRVFSNVKPSTFQILTVRSEDAVARYLDNIKPDKNDLYCSKVKKASFVKLAFDEQTCVVHRIQGKEGT